MQFYASILTRCLFFYLYNNLIKLEVGSTNCLVYTAIFSVLGNDLGDLGLLDLDKIKQ